jgi:hypothetical protein
MSEEPNEWRPWSELNEAGQRRKEKTLEKYRQIEEAPWRSLFSQAAENAAKKAVEPKAQQNFDKLLQKRGARLEAEAAAGAGGAAEAELTAEEAAAAAWEKRKAARAAAEEKEMDEEEEERNFKPRLPLNKSQGGRRRKNRKTTRRHRRRLSKRSKTARRR